MEVRHVGMAVASIIAVLAIFGAFLIISGRLVLTA
jgi:hypothetical protein